MTDLTVVLRNWKVFAIKARQSRYDGIKVVVGYHEPTDSTIITGDVLKFVPHRMEIETEDTPRRRWRLEGEPGLNRNGQHDWAAWCARKMIVDITDITGRYLQKKRRAA